MLRKIYRRLYVSKNNENEYLQKLFYNLDSLGVKLPLFLDGYSGNASLMYAILKILVQSKPSSILELGSGQSTLMIDRLIGELDLSTKLVSVEHEAFWHSKITEMITSEQVTVHHAELKEIKSGKYYDLESLFSKHSHFDLIIIDGPPRGIAKRGEIASFIKKYSLITEDFVILVDDAHHASEKHTINEVTSMLEAQNFDYETLQLIARKHQTLYAGGTYKFLTTA